MRFMWHIYLLDLFGVKLVSCRGSKSKGHRFGISWSAASMLNLNVLVDDLIVCDSSTC